MTAVVDVWDVACGVALIVIALVYSTIEIKAKIWNHKQKNSGKR